jgi:hypothetical protein
MGFNSGLKGLSNYRQYHKLSLQWHVTLCSKPLCRIKQVRSTNLLLLSLSSIPLFCIPSTYCVFFFFIHVFRRLPLFLHDLFHIYHLLSLFLNFTLTSLHVPRRSKVPDCRTYAGLQYATYFVDNPASSKCQTPTA